MRPNPFTKMADYDVCSAMSAIFKRIITADNFVTFFAAFDEVFLIVMAMRSRGPDNVRSLVAGVKDAFDEYAREQVEKRDTSLIERFKKEREAAENEADFAFNTGDPVYDNFRNRLRHYDWYADYSDDGDVWRAAERELNELNKIAEENGDRYKQAIVAARKFYCRIK